MFFSNQKCRDQAIGINLGDRTKIWINLGHLWGAAVNDPSSSFIQFLDVQQFLSLKNKRMAITAEHLWRTLKPERLHAKAFSRQRSAAKAGSPAATRLGQKSCIQILAWRIGISVCLSTYLPTQTWRHLYISVCVCAVGSSCCVIIPVYHINY